MLTTQFPGGLRARPLEARPDRDAGIIWFLTDARSGKDDEVAAGPDIGLVFVDLDDKAYLSENQCGDAIDEAPSSPPSKRGCHQSRKSGSNARDLERRNRETVDLPGLVVAAYFEAASGTQVVFSRSYLKPGAAFNASLVVSMVR